MEPHRVLFLADVAEARDWIARHARDATETWVGFDRVRYGADRDAAPGFQAVAEEFAGAGWVDSGRAVVDERRYAVRFAPGKVVRHRRVEHAAPDEPVDLPSSGPAYDELRANAAAWAFFEKQPPRYRRAAIWWVTSGKAEQTRQRRLAALVAASAAGERVAQIERQL